MPFGLKPQCAVCKCISSHIWRKTEIGEILCNSCNHNKTAKISSNIRPPTPEINICTTNISDTPNTGAVNNNNKKDGVGIENNGSAQNPPAGRKSTRKTAKSKQHSQAKSGALKGKSRRIIFKKSATKAPTAIATPVTTESLYSKGLYYQVGDIVSMVDVAGDVYYAQIRGLLQDQYCEKSAVITWLLPTTSSTTDHFDPTTYIVGPEEDIPRKLDSMEFVCHAPSDYFKCHNSPYPTISNNPQCSFIWTRLGPQIRPIVTDDVFSNI